ncbi:hypothetical protein RJT34_04140 [Clitoria ternatea]|uniref:Protein LNK1 n=1 Tax=Clitoria ternatea TaxID=43366 RepID=A0AAN9KP68_CLITE
MVLISAQGKEDSSSLNEKERMLEKGSWSHRPEDPFSPYDTDSCKEQNKLTSDNTRVSDHCFKSSNLDCSSSSELCADSILGDKCAVEDDSLSQYSINHISQTDNELSFLDNDGWLNIGNFEDVDRMMLNCDLTFGMESLNNEEFCWLSSSHGTQGSDYELKSEFKFSSAEASPLKSISDYNIATKENIGLTINDCNNRPSPTDNKVRCPMDVDHAVPSSLSMVSESDMEPGDTDDLMPKQKMQRKQSKPSSGKRKNGYLQNGDSDHPYAHVEQYANLKQSLGVSSSGVTSQDSIHKHRPNMNCDSLGHVEMQTHLMHPDYSHTSNYTSVLPTLSGSRSENGGHLSPSFKESSYASNMENSHGLPFEDCSLKTTNDKGENLYIHNDAQLLNGGFKSENMENPVPFRNPGSAQKVEQQLENDKEDHSELGRVSIGFSHEIDSSNVQDTSSMSSALDETSHEATSFRQLQQVMQQMDIRTKLCIRDSLYRLAKSAEERHNDASASGQVGDDAEACKAIMTQDANRCTGFMNMETNTNPIDRSIAHLLFHRPSDSSTMPLNDPLPFQSSSMIHGSVINSPVMTEKQVCQEESSAGVEKKPSGVTPQEK